MSEPERKRTNNYDVKIRVFQAPDSRKPQNFQPEKRFWIKNRIISERSDDGLSSHAFISISKFLTKIEFLGVGGGHKKFIYNS
jgi:hypothetical protein